MSENLDEAIRRVMDAVQAAVDQVAIGRSLAEQVGLWNEESLQRRKEILALICDSPIPGDEVVDVQFEMRGYTPDGCADLAANVKMSEPREQVTMTVTRS